MQSKQSAQIDAAQRVKGETDQHHAGEPVDPRQHVRREFRGGSGDEGSIGSDSIESFFQRAWSAAIIGQVTVPIFALQSSTNRREKWGQRTITTNIRNNCFLTLISGRSWPLTDCQHSRTIAYGFWDSPMFANAAT
jgi:hypothetical protein